jgi:hypothetical protein
VFAREVEQHGAEEEAAQARRYAHAHVAAHGLAQAIDGGTRGLHFLQHAAAVLEQRLAGLRELQAARGAAQQLRAGLALQHLQAVAQVRARHAQLLRGSGKAARFHDLDKQVDEVEVHGAGR